MFPDRTCPNCRSPVPVLATECVHCRAPLPANDPRYNVQRAGQPPASAPVDAGILPPDVRVIDDVARVWYCKIGGQTVGPCQAADIRDAFAKGQIDGQASVGVQGHQAWYPIRTLPQFAHLITGVGAAPGPRSPGPRSPAPLPGPAAAPAPLPAAQPLHGAPLPGPAPGGATSARSMTAAATVPVPRPAVQGLQPSPELVRDDETQLVQPLPPPNLAAIGDSTGQVSDPGIAAWRAEVKSLKRLVWVFGLLSAALLVAAATLLGLLVSQ